MPYLQEVVIKLLARLVSGESSGEPYRQVGCISYIKSSQKILDFQQCGRCDISTWCIESVSNGKFGPAIHQEVINAARQLERRTEFEVYIFEPLQKGKFMDMDTK